MSDCPVAQRAPDDGEQSPPLPRKSPRESLVLLRVEASPCTLVLERILFFVNSAALRPADMAIDYGRKWQMIEIWLDGNAFAPSEWFLTQLEGLPAVKLAEFFDGFGSPLVLAQEERADEPIRSGGRWDV
ncbi:MAG: hypothetical protein EOP62_02820 [Sphingomonadales bacterium]|nr:MAG: hypothetical protein EOP62_02820 [Sphingomonadales bacterium]